MESPGPRCKELGIILIADVRSDFIIPLTSTEAFCPASLFALLLVRSSLRHLLVLLASFSLHVVAHSFIHSVTNDMNYLPVAEWFGSEVAA